MKRPVLITATSLLAIVGIVGWSQRSPACQDAARHDKARLFIELTADGLKDFQREMAERSVPTKETWWGYDTIQVNDPDGNELLFPKPD
jgi:hypothetical protein